MNQGVRKKRIDETVERPVTGPRWKKLGGDGLEAAYRAVCGRPRCPGHLGDLAYFPPYLERMAMLHDEARRERAEIEQEYAQARKFGHEPEVVNALADLLSDAREDEAEAARDVASAAAAMAAAEASRLPIGDALGWVLSASFHPRFSSSGSMFLPDKHAIYAGYADTGYRIVVGGKRSRNGDRIGRRPIRPNLPSEVVRAFGKRPVQGQDVVLPAVIQCPVCGTRNQVDYPAEWDAPAAR